MARKPNDRSFNQLHFLGCSPTERDPCARASDKTYKRTSSKTSISRIQVIGREEREESVRGEGEENPCSNSAPGSLPLAVTWQIPDTVREKLAAVFPQVIHRLPSMRDDFVVYWTVGKGAGKRKKLWDRAFVNWVRNQLRFESARGPRKKASTVQQTCATRFAVDFAGDDFPEWWKP